ncbi:cytotoxin [Salinicoccus sp. YB14-2]|uniref:cytotoxin n=1 Tax=Salinicoccus sp. YB14-2 TaxID=1572701 RepID=UPI000B200246|nr:cytotoxin [Salinicoccus sp. YB14-2]
MMNLQRTARFDTNFTKLDPQAQKAIKKALRFMVTDFNHPSLRMKKMEGWDYIFEAGANMDIRITFHFEKTDTIVLRNCGHHDRTLKNT